MAAKKVIGRPLLPHNKGKKAIFSMRTTKEIRVLILEAAHKNGRSMAAEVEHRVVTSFHDDNLGEVRDEIRQLRKAIEDAFGVPVRLLGKESE